MSTRLKRPSILRQLSITLLLLSFLTYLGMSAVTGRFGINGQQQLLDDIRVLKAEKATLGAHIDDYRSHVDLFDPTRLDPDILTENARLLLSMGNPDEIIVPLNSTYN